MIEISRIALAKLVGVALALASLNPSSFAQSSLSTFGWQSLNNVGTNLHFLDFQSSGSGAAINTVGSKSFTGLDGANNAQTMGYAGSSFAESAFGSLHARASANLTNSYYNAGNSAYVAANGSVADPNGSPTSLASSGTAIFTDTLQFGGSALQAGYKARYIFHVDGLISGTNAFGVLGVDVGADNDTIGIGATPMNWGTKSFDINGATPQSIKVQLDAATIFDTFALTDGQSYSGTADFSSTATLTGIEVLDPFGNSASGWTVTSSSGTIYATIQAPEPTSLALVLLGGFGFVRLRQRKK